MPDSAPAQSNYGTGLKAAGRLKEAMERFEAALAIDPGYARAYNNMGNAMQALGDYESAMAAHGQAIKLEPKLASAYSNLGNALRELGKAKLAVTALTSAVTLNPSFAAAYTNLGSATMALGDVTIAAKWHGLAAALHRRWLMLRPLPLSAEVFLEGRICARWSTALAKGSKSPGIAKVETVVLTVRP